MITNEYSSVVKSPRLGTVPRRARRCRIPAAQPQDRPLAYAIVRVCAAGMLHLLCPPALTANFSRYLELSHRQIPDVNMSAQAPPGLRAPVIPAREQPAPATKRKPAPLICRHLDFRTFREAAFFAPAPAPCPVQVNLRGFQMTKCQISGKIAECQIRRSVPAGKHENVPRCISTAPLRGNRNALPSGNAERQGSSGAADEKVLWYAVSRFFFIGHG